MTRWGSDKVTKYKLKMVGRMSNKNIEQIRELIEKTAKEYSQIIRECRCRCESEQQKIERIKKKEEK